MILHSLRYVSSTVPEVSFDTARGIFLPCSRYASTMLEVRFDRAPGMFPRCSRYISTELDVGFDSAQGIFERGRCFYGPCLRYVLILL